MIHEKVAPNSPGNWYVREINDILDELETSEAGLEQSEAARRLETYGPNQLPHQPPPTLWSIVLVAGGATDSEGVAARNSLLILMVLFENVHIGSCRSETKSALFLSPLRSPILLAGAMAALSIHVIAMHVPWGQAILETAPLAPDHWLVLLAIALVILAVMELHKLSWWWRLHRQRAASAPD